MKILLNDKEIIHFLISLIDHTQSCKNIEFNEKFTGEAIGWVLEKRDGPGKFNLGKFKKKIKDRIEQGVRTDAKNYLEMLKTNIQNREQYYTNIFKQQLPYILDKLGEDRVLDFYSKSKKQGFCKTVGFSLSNDAILVRRSTFDDQNENCLLRNTVGNEKLLVNKLDKQLPFWFIDSGYTNFIEPNKKWHRLVQNHIHYSQYFQAPTDRLGNFPKFPKPWRLAGDKILILEPGPFASSIFHINTREWKYNIVKELRKYTDKKIYFRAKINKKIRKDLYQKLLDDDYYCTISLNSNSAVESIWAGVPAITLGKHVSNPVTVNNLDQINNLYRGELGNWLAWLSYNQFTYEELMNGFATRTIKTYHV